MREGAFMEQWVLGMLFGFVIVGFIALAIRLEKCHSSIALMATNLHTSLKDDIRGASEETSDNFIDGIREELLDVVNATIQQMRPPNIADHLGGILNQFAQMKMMKMMQKDGLVPGLDANALASTINNPQENEESWQDVELDAK